MKPIEIACSYAGKPNGITLFVCGAQAGELCRDPNGKTRESFHADRIADAAAINSLPANISKEEFDKAVEDNDLI